MTAISTPAQKATVSGDVRLRDVTIVIGRRGLALLFFTQLFWKLPHSGALPPK